MKAYIKINNDLSINGKKYKLGKEYLDNFQLKFYENISDIFCNDLQSSIFDLSNSGIYEVKLYDSVHSNIETPYDEDYLAANSFIVLKEVDYSLIKMNKENIFENEDYKITISLYKNFKSYNLFDFLNIFKNNLSIKTIFFNAFFYNISKKDVSLFDKDKYKYIVESNINMFFDKFPEKYHDCLTNSEYMFDKFILINFGRISDLDCFLDENDPRLIEKIIEKGRDKDLDLFVNNKFTEIRMAVAKNCRKKDLLILKDDKSKEIREFAESVLEIET